MGEHLLCKQRVVGSSPSTSTFGLKRSQHQVLAQALPGSKPIWDDSGADSANGMALPGCVQSRKVASGAKAEPSQEELVC